MTSPSNAASLNAATPDSTNTPTSMMQESEEHKKQAPTPTHSTQSTGTRSEAEPGMGMETTSSFERHLVDVENEAQKLGSELRGMHQDLKVFEKQIEEEKEECEFDQEDHDFVIEDLGRLLGEEERDLELAGNEGEWIPEVILGRKVKVGGRINQYTGAVSKQRIFYKVKWRGINCVTWELEEHVTTPNLIKQFEDRWMKKAFSKSKRLRPLYKSPLGSKQPQFRDVGDALPVGAVPPGVLTLNGQVPAYAGDRAQKGSWSCEVEPRIFVPYDDGLQQQIERAYVACQKEVKITIGGPNFTLSFERMTQERYAQDDKNQKVVGALAGAVSVRKIQRTIALPEDEERRLTEAMNVDQLRSYIANIVDFTPLHYELLSRLHEMDKVIVSASDDAVAKLAKVAFEEVLAAEAAGKEYPGFSSDCLLCLDEYEATAPVVVLECGHFFHQKCVENYLQKYSNNCPVCKAEVK